MNAQQYLNRGLGCAQMGNTPPPLPDSVVNYQVPIPTSPTTNTGGNFWDSLNNIFSNINKTASALAPVANQVKSTVDLFKNNTTIPGYTTPLPGAPAPVQSNLIRNVLIGVAGAGVVGTLIYLATRKKKRSLNGMSKKYFVTYDKKKGGTGIVMVKAENPITALKNARYLVATGSNFRNAEETNDNYTKPSKKGYQGRGRQN